MKQLLLAALLLPAVLTAQTALPGVARPLPPLPAAMRPATIQVGSQAAAEVFPDNYQVTLNLTNKDGPPLEISVVVASPQFSAMLGEESLNFSGNVTVEESGSIVIAYNLGWVTPAPVPAGSFTQHQQSSTQGSVRLKLGEEVQIIRAGTRTARLSITKLELSKAKAK